MNLATKAVGVLIAIQCGSLLMGWLTGPLFLITLGGTASLALIMLRG